MKKIFKIAPWIISAIFVALYIWDNAIYQKRNTVRMSSGLIPLALEEDRLALYYNNLGETIRSNAKFEVRFYLIKEDKTWTVQSIIPTIQDKQLSIFQSKEQKEIFAINENNSNAIRWNYGKQILDEIPKDQVPNLSTMQPLVASAEYFRRVIEK